MRKVAVLVLILVPLWLYLGCQTSTSGGGGSDAAQVNDGTDEGSNVEGGGEADADDDGSGGSGGSEDVGDSASADDGDAADDDGPDTSDSGAPDNETGFDDGSSDDGGVDDADSGNDGAEDGDAGSDGLSEDEEEAVEDALDAIESLSALLAALADAGLPSTGDGPVVVTPNPESGCPTITVDDSTLTLDYGDGCNPVLYPETTVSGSATGQINAAERSLTLTFDDLVIDGESVSGTLTTSVAQADDTATFEATVDLTFSDGETSFTVAGYATVQVDLTTGEMFIPSAELTVSDDGDTYEVTLTDVHIDPAEGLPDSGTATVAYDNEGPGTTTLEITFTDATPTEGSVLVSVNGSPAIELSLSDLESAL